MLFRFPPTQIQAGDPTFLTDGATIFAKLKIEQKAGKRLVFLTEHTLLMVLQGSKLLHFADHTCQVDPGQLLLLKKGIYVMAEYIEQGQQFEALLLCLPVKLLRAQQFDLPPAAAFNTVEKPYLLFGTDPFTEQFKAGLRQYFNRAAPAWSDLLQLKQKEILLLLLASDYRLEIIRFLQEATGASEGGLEFVVHQYLFQPVTLAELAGLCNRSLASFKRDFQRIYRTSPRRYVNRQRVAQAQLLLRNTRQNIAEVSLNCGFEDPSYFSRLFRTTTGLTPAAYRAKNAMF